MTDEEALERFKAFCIEDARLKAIAKGFKNGSPEWCEAEVKCVDINDERDWYDMSVGFFIGIGCTVPQSHDLALKARYDHYYWCE